jgi:hypothetical protein
VQNTEKPERKKNDQDQTQSAAKPRSSVLAVTSSIVGPHMAHLAVMTVTEVATQFGVWKYGHLANDYQLLFWGTSFRDFPRRTQRWHTFFRSTS